MSDVGCCTSEKSLWLSTFDFFVSYYIEGFFYTSNLKLNSILLNNTYSTWLTRVTKAFVNR